MSKGNHVERVDGYRGEKKYAGTPVGRVTELLIRTVIAPLEAIDNFVYRRVKKATRRG